MIDANSQSLLNDLLRKEARSFVQYLGEAYPFTTPKTHELAKTLTKLVAEEQHDYRHLMEVLRKKRYRLPYFGAYPMSFTTMNYMDLGYLKRYLVDQEKQRIAELELAVTKITDGDVRPAVEAILTRKKKHLQMLLGEHSADSHHHSHA